MSKSKHRNHKKRAPAPSTPARSHRKLVIVLLLSLSLGIGGGIFARWRAARSARLNAARANAQTSPSPGSPSKEYIYAGGRLIATEAPGGGTSALSAPASFAAIATSDHSINLQWAASTGGTVDHYQVERCANINTAPSCYTFVADVPPATPTINYNDAANLSTGAAYLYHVRAVDSSGNFSNYSNIDLATTIIFEDDELNPAGTRTVIRARHLVQLRQAVNAVRALAGLAAASWTYPDPVSEPASQRRPVYLEDVTDLRTKLDEALTVLGLSQSYATEPPLGRWLPIRKEHFQELRQRVK